MKPAFDSQHKILYNKSNSRQIARRRVTLTRGRKKQTSLLPLAVGDDESLHFRLCHICFYLNESLNEITRCERCRKNLSFNYAITKMSESESVENSEREQEVDEIENYFGDRSTFRRRVPLTGLDVIW